MSSVKKINFPYLIEKKEVPKNEKIVVFFGTDFYNLPIGSNRDEYILITNKILDYIRKNFDDFKLIYQPHPNEKDEFDHLNLKTFEVGSKKVAEIFLYENANRIEYCFSTCSWANGSAFAMGINSAIFLDLLEESISSRSIQGYRSYFEGLPKEFFIKSLDEEPPIQNHNNKNSQLDSLESILEAIGDSKKIWILATDPALAMRGALLGKFLKARDSGVEINLLYIGNNRWNHLSENRGIFSVFDHTQEVSRGRVVYSLRPNRVFNAVRVARNIRKLNIDEGTLISFSNLLFEENCIFIIFPDKIESIK